MVQPIQNRKAGNQVQPSDNQMYQYIDRQEQYNGRNGIDEHVGQIHTDVFCKLVHAQHFVYLTVIILQ